MEKSFALIVVFIIVAVGLTGYHLTTKRVLSRYFAGREPVRPSEFGDRFYAESSEADIATFVMLNVQDLAGYDFTGAQPDDRINADLHLDEIDSLANVEIITRVEERYDIQISDEEAARVETVDDFVRLISSKVARRG